MKHVVGILTALFILASASSVFASSNDNEVSSFGDGVAAYSLQNYEKAVQIWQTLAENLAENNASPQKSSAEAAYRLAQLYDLGLGVNYNPEMVVKWLTLASDNGITPAQYMLAEIYASGRGVPTDSLLSYELYKKAALNGHPKSMYQLASIYYLGEGVEKDNLSAAFWFKKSADSLGSAAQKNVANSVYNSIFTKLNDAEKLILLKRLATIQDVSK